MTDEVTVGFCGGQSLYKPSGVFMPTFHTKRVAIKSARAAMYIFFFYFFYLKGSKAGGLFRGPMVRL